MTKAEFVWYLQGHLYYCGGFDPKQGSANWRWCITDDFGNSVEIA